MRAAARHRSARADGDGAGEACPVAGPTLCIRDQTLRHVATPMRAASSVASSGGDCTASTQSALLMPGMLQRNSPGGWPLAGPDARDFMGAGVAVGIRIQGTPGEAHARSQGEGHRACHRRRRPGRPLPRRGRRAPPVGGVDRARREEPEPGRRGRPPRSAPTSSRRTTASCSRRPEVTAAIIATDEHLHVAPILAAVERGVPLLIEKPLATDLAQSARVLEAIEQAKVDAVVGYTQRFRRKWLVGQGEGAHRRARRRDARHQPRVHEPAGRHRQLQAHRRPRDHLADGDLRHARARHRHVVHGGQDAGRMLRALDRQGAGPALRRHRRHRRHDHVLPTAASITSTSPGRCP